MSSEKKFNINNYDEENPLGRQTIFIDDPVDYAEKLGEEHYGRIGKLAFPELEISYLMTCLRRRAYSDNPRIRARRHVLLYWENSYYKSTILEDFSWECCGGRELNRAYRTYDRVHFINLTGDIKRPILRGSINQVTGKNGNLCTKLVLPLMKYADLWVADELLDFLGEDSSEMLNYMLNVLESGRGKVAMVSMVGAKISARDEKKLRMQGVTFDSDLGLMSYWCKGTFWAGTRPIPRQDKKLVNKLWLSGYLNRFVIVPWIPELGEREQMLVVKRDAKPNHKQYLYTNNRVFWNTHFKCVNTPPKDLWEEATSFCRNEFVRETTKRKLNYSPNPRDGLNSIQLLTVGALIHTVRSVEDKRLLSGKGYKLKHQSLEYHPCVLDWAKKYIRRYVVNKCVFLEQIGKVLEKDENKSYGDILARYPKDSLIRMGIVVKDIVKDCKISERQARKVIHDLKESGMIKILGTGARKQIKILKSGE